MLQEFAASAADFSHVASLRNGCPDYHRLGHSRFRARVSSVRGHELRNVSITVPWQSKKIQIILLARHRRGAVGSNLYGVRPAALRHVVIGDRRQSSGMGRRRGLPAMKARSTALGAFPAVQCSDSARAAPLLSHAVDDSPVGGEADMACVVQKEKP